MARNKTVLKSKLSTSEAERKSQEKRLLKHYYYSLAIHDHRPLINACVILHRYGGEMHTDKLLSKMRSRALHPHLQVAESLGLTEREGRQVLVKWKRKKLLEPMFFLATETKLEVENAIRSHKERYEVWTNETVIENKLTDKGREIAERAIELNFLQATKTRRYFNGLK
jgi:hypothetical protein